MARGLATLLGRPKDKLLLLTLEDLEKATGSKGVDVKLLGDILHRAHGAMRALKLDSTDTTAKELYNALRVNDDEDILRKTAHVGLIVGNACISFNADDIAADNKKSVQFEERSLRHMQKALLEEVKQRYEAKAPASDRLVPRLLSKLKI